MREVPAREFGIRLQDEHKQELDAIMEDGELFRALQYVAFREDHTASRETIRQACDYLFMNYRMTDDQKRDVMQITGDAYKLMLDLEGAHSFYRNSGSSLDDLADVALWLGKHPRMVARLPVERDDYEAFLRTRALPHLQMIRDGSRFFINEDSLDFILDSLYAVGVEDTDALAGAVSQMESAGNMNLPKKRILAHLSGDKDLIQRCDKEFDALLDGHRDRIETVVKEYCALNSLTYLGRMQEGDTDEFFPVASNIFLIEKEGRKEVLKENLALYLDFSDLGGYSCEKEIYESFENDAFVGYKGSVQIDGIEFLRFDHFGGKELGEYKASMPLKEVARVMSRIADAVRSMHEVGIMYLDIKEKNFLYDGKDLAVVDMGMAQMKPCPIGRETVGRSLLSTPKYIPPEWGRNFRVNATTEVFQMGILMHELITGEHPFACYDFIEGDSHRESEIMKYALANMHRSYNAPGSAPGEIKYLLTEMLDKDPVKRPLPGDVYRRLDSFIRRCEA